MKQTRPVWKIIGWILFLLAAGLFCIQLAYFYGHEKFQVEYIDDRLFYIINIFFIICLLLANFLLLRLNKLYQLIGTGLAILFILVHVVLLMDSNSKVNNVTSLSPDFKHVLSIKENRDSVGAVYYRSYYGILARPKELLTSGDSEMQVEWLSDDIAAVTYQKPDKAIDQFIATYGDRGGGVSYYDVGAEIHGKWQADNVEVISNEDGITVKEDRQTELFLWENIEQFGTLAVVLKKDNAAVWTIALNENFKVHSDASKAIGGHISLYKVTMEDNSPIVLEYMDSQ